MEKGARCVVGNRNWHLVGRALMHSPTTDKYNIDNYSRKVQNEKRHQLVVICPAGV